ncbi:DUF308 domain-containing protein [Arthrobacter sp. E3]|uniref:DUF308 domain-containing protein n=1 Tax=Arthrobacter sp. E3 TaxID=517402 RepID=UPI001B3565C9|nr:DUF308 domain-containing protein [Arthrobacter sp. E3]
MTTPELPGAGSQQTSPHQSEQSPIAQQGLGSPTQTLTPPPTAPPIRAKKPFNILGLIALITAVLGFIFACIPGALIVGWILLPIAFVLALVSLFLKDKAKWMGITALIASIIGTIVGVSVFFAVVATSFDNAFSSGDTTVAEPSNGAAANDAAVEKKPDVNGRTRENPSPIGSVIESDDWRVVINSVTFAATDAVLGANEFNDPPAEGSEYILVDYSATYLGDDAEGQMPAFVSIEYVTASGTTVNGFDNIATAPNPIDTTSTLYKDGTATGNTVFAVPTSTAGQGVLAVRPGMLADKVFVAVK